MSFLKIIFINYYIVVYRSLLKRYFLLPKHTISSFRAKIGRLIGMTNTLYRLTTGKKNNNKKSAMLSPPDHQLLKHVWGGFELWNDVT